MKISCQYYYDVEKASLIISKDIRVNPTSEEHIKFVRTAIRLLEDLENNYMDQRLKEIAND